METDDHARAEAVIRAARKANRQLLTELESKQILDAYGIPTVETHVAQDEEEAMRIAAKLGGAVVLKLYSEDVTHKTDGGRRQAGFAKRKGNPSSDIVRSKRRAVRTRMAFSGVTVEPMIPADGYELMLGSSIDRNLAPCCFSVPGDNLSR